MAAAKDGLRRDPKTGIFYLDIHSGTDRVRRSTGTTNRKEAQLIRDKVKAELFKVKQLGQSRTRTLGEACGAWEAAAERAGKRSLHDDQQRLSWWRLHFGDDKPLHEVARKAVILEAADTLVSERSIAPATRNRYVSALRVVLQFAADREWIAGVPKIELEDEPDEAPDKPLTKEQAVTLLSQLPDHQFRLVVFSLATGLRQGNVTGMEWERVDMERRLCWITTTGSKSKKPMPIPLNDQAISILEGQRGLHERWVFVYKGERIKYPNNTAWRAAKMRAGLHERFRWHALRHTWATWHVLNGTLIHELKELGGWSRIDMPMRYQHMSGHHVAHKAGAVAMETIPESRDQQRAREKAEAKKGQPAGGKE